MRLVTLHSQLKAPSRGKDDSARGKALLVLRVSLKWLLGRAQIISDYFRRS